MFQQSFKGCVGCPMADQQEKNIVEEDDGDIYFKKKCSSTSTKLPRLNMLLIWEKEV